MHGVDVGMGDLVLLEGQVAPYCAQRKKDGDGGKVER